MMPSDFRKMAAMILIGLTPSVLASEWRVETTNLKITEPSSLAGQYDSAMGDVRFLNILHDKESPSSQEF